MSDEREVKIRRRVNMPSHRRGIISRAPKPSSPSRATRRRVRPVAAFPSKPLTTENVTVLKRSRSEPLLLLCNGVRESDVKVSKDEEVDGVLYRPRTCMDIFDSQENYVGKCNNNYELYNKDAKVVVNVTVEGSPGPIRTMVKLGSNVDETIKLVVNKYNEEGRTPRLNKDSASTFELHHSYFSLESLSRSDLIGDVRSRSFYLRKYNNSSFRSDDDSIAGSIASSNQLDDVSQLPLILRFFDREFRKFIRKTRTICKVVGCLPYA